MITDGAESMVDMDDLFDEDDDYDNDETMQLDELQPTIIRISNATLWMLFLAKIQKDSKMFRGKR